MSAAVCLSSHLSYLIHSLPCRICSVRLSCISSPPYTSRLSSTLGARELYCKRFHLQCFQHTPYLPPDLRFQPRLKSVQFVYALAQHVAYRRPPGTTCTKAACTKVRFPYGGGVHTHSRVVDCALGSRSAQWSCCASRDVGSRGAQWSCVMKWRRAGLHTATAATNLERLLAQHTTRT